MKEQSHYITLETYKNKTTQEFLPWDKNMDSMILSYNEELHYEPKSKT